jgi:membrane-associated phospholipid phosphatase
MSGANWGVRAGFAMCLLICGVPRANAQSVINTMFPKAKLSSSTASVPRFSAWDDQEQKANPPSPSLDDMEQRRDVNWRRLPKNFVQDQKDMWLFPLKVAQGRYVWPTVAVTGITAGLIVADPHLQPHISNTDLFQDTNDALNAKVSGGIIAGVPSVFYLVALLRHDHYDQATSLFAGQAVADDTILMIVLKAITRRERPSDRPLAGPYNDTFFKSNSGPLGKGSSFPSGHAMMGFSVATVFARRYKQHKWVPWVAYGTASVLSFTRITTGAHFPSDVFIGGALGYAMARYNVLHGN